MNTLAIDPLLIFWFISFLLSFPIPSNPKSLLFPILSSFLNPEFAFKGKHVTIWPDNDDPGKDYAEKAAKKLLDLGVASLSILKIPQDKPKGWDAADCIQEGIDVEKFLTTTIRIPCRKNVTFFLADQYLNEKSSGPGDIIAPRVLTPGGLLVFGGAPKVGKSDFLISWLTYMAAGKSFPGMSPTRL